MDWEAGKERIIAYIKKYRYIVLMVFTGIFFMLLPDAPQTVPLPVPAEETRQENLETRLSEILSCISGVGEAKVLLTEELGSHTIYQTDSDLDETNTRQDTVVITNGNREEGGLVKQVNPPVYLGAVVVCQGGDSPSVRLAVVEAVRSVTGLSADRIRVLKMK